MPLDSDEMAAIRTRFEELQILAGRLAKELQFLKMWVARLEVR